MKNNANNETKKLTLAEMKNLVPTTRGKARPTAKYLRENETVVAMSECGESKMAMYASGFALYANSGHQYVIRLDCIHSAEYELMEEDGPRNTYVPLDDLDWDTAVLLDGEQRMEANRIRRLARTTVSMTGTGVQDEDSESADMELDTGVDIAGDYERKEEKAEAARRLEEVLSCLTERQREIYLLSKLEGFSQRQIAARLGLNQKTVCEALNSAEKKLKKYLGKYENTPSKGTLSCL